MTHLPDFVAPSCLIMPCSLNWEMWYLIFPWEYPNRDSNSFRVIKGFPFKDNNGNGNEGLAKALADAKSHGVDFVIFGGDLTDIDGLKPEQESTADDP